MLRNGPRAESRRLTRRGARLLKRAGRTGDPARLDEAVEAFTAATDALPAGDPYQAVALGNLATALVARFDATGVGFDLDLAESTLRQALVDNRGGSVGHEEILSDLVGVLGRRYEVTRAVADLEKKLAVLREGLQSGWTGPRWLEGQLGLGLALAERFELAGNPADLDAAVQALCIAGTLGPRRAPGRYALASLGGALHQRFKLTAQPADLDEAVRGYGEAARAAGRRDPMRLAYCVTLGLAYLERYRHGAVESDLDAAVAAFEAASSASGSPDLDRAVALWHLGNTLRERYVEASQRPADLKAALHALQEAVTCAAPDDPRRADYARSLQVTRLLAKSPDSVAPQWLADLAASYHSEADSETARESIVVSASPGAARLNRCMRSGDPAELQAAIDELRATSGDADRPPAAETLTNLGTALVARYELTRDGTDLDEGVSLLRQALASLPASEPARASVVSNLGGGLRAQFLLRGDRTALDAAVTLARAELARPHPPYARASILVTLGMTLRMQFLDACMSLVDR